MGFKIYSGRTSRLEFWCFQIIYGLLICLVVVADGWGLMFSLTAMGLFLPSLVPCHVRRLHDVEYSGWFLLPKFFYVPWFLFAARATLHGGSMNDFFFQNASLVEQFKITSLLYCGLIYEIILVSIYLQRGTAGLNIYGKDSVEDLQKGIKTFTMKMLSNKK